MSAFAAFPTSRSPAPWSASASGPSHASNSPDALGRRLAAAEAAEVAARAASRAKTDLLAMMGHELRTPLNAISGFVQLLDLGAYGPITAEQHDALLRIDRAQRHLLRLVKDLTDLVRIETGHLSVTIAEVRVQDLIADLESMVGAQSERGSTPFVVTGCERCVVLADRERLLQILINLFSNALKYAPEGEVIRLDCPTRSTGGGDPRVAYLRIRDDGPGIPLDKQGTIFEPFARLDSASARRPEGVGLGLAISRDLAQRKNSDLRMG